MGKKAAHKMLMKLTTSVNFINILRRYFGAKNYEIDTKLMYTFFTLDRYTTLFIGPE